jgi:hypothetical protein
MMKKKETEEENGGLKQARRGRYWCLVGMWRAGQMLMGKGEAGGGRNRSSWICGLA